MKNNLWISFLLVLLVVGCSQEEIFRNKSEIPEGRVFTTSFESDESRTYVEDGRLSRWTADDRITLFDGNSLNRQYKFDGETGDNAGTFSIVEKPYGTGETLHTNYAVYPYNKDIKISEKGVITVTLPVEQSYAENSFGLGANTMVAVTEDLEDTFLNFKNVGGCFKLQLYGDDVTVKSIILKGNNEEKIAGNAYITSVYGEQPTIEMAQDATASVTLDCGEEGVKLGTTRETATSFWMVLPPTTFEKGITISVIDANDGVFTQTTSKELAIERNVVKPMVAVEVEPEIPYLTFMADSTQTFLITNQITNLEYSVGNGEWTYYTYSQKVEFGGELGNVKFRGKNSKGTVELGLWGPRFQFANATPVACTGDIRTLIDYENYKTADTKEAKFCGLFCDCTVLTSAPELPITELAENAYYYMFYGCTSLTKAPELPATTMTKECYREMFGSCTSLIEAPELPATTLAYCCYNIMFKGCTSLVQAPALPATTLAERCYWEMFSGCTSLVNAPELPATTLANFCYLEMFSGCTSLVNAPALPATTLTAYCYDCMFSGCTSLTQAPELPAMTLDDYCYYGMFSGCTSLTQAPALPAMTLINGCYSNMFSGCTSLTEASELPAMTLGGYCYYGMFSGCTSLTEAPELPAMTLGGYCYYGMFSGCTSLTEAPELPAMTLGVYCYYGMFSDCSNLQNITMLATDISAKGCLDNWVKNVAATGTFTKAAEMESLPIGVNGIPEGWIVKNNVDTENIPYLTFTADAKQTLTMSKAVKTIEYSVGDGDWSELGTNRVEFGGELGVLRLRGKSLMGTASSEEDCSVIRFLNSTPVFSSGDICTLVDYENYQMADTKNARFCNLFYECSCLKTAPDLSAPDLASYCYYMMFFGCFNLIEVPAISATTLGESSCQFMFYNCTSLVKAPELLITSLADYCYYYMFSSCTSLKEAPELPATTLAKGCYCAMFMDCISLTQAPELPATTLANGCYGSMFYGCTSLTQAPELPAMTMDNNSYAGMFSGCTSLVEAPELPSTTVSGRCYREMFKDCVSLVIAPELPAAKLAYGCYEGMFSGCSQLKLITMLATDISIGDCLKNWVSNISPSGIFVKTAEMESLPGGINGIPEGWEVINYGETIDLTPYLTFTADATQTLTMSKTVENLEYSLNGGEWIVLGTQTVEFGGSNGSLRLRGKNKYGTAIDEDNDYSTIILGNETSVSCYGDIRTLVNYENFEKTNTSEARFCRLFSNCTSLITAPELPAISLASNCYASMFNGCSNLASAPELPATTLTNGCYNEMFALCSNLTIAPVLPATTLADYCYNGMFAQCPNLTEVSALPATTLAIGCYDHMFFECTSLISAPELPATSLTASCYRDMFSGCSNLENVPVLPATTLADYCYSGMFALCSTLTIAPELPATTLAYGCYDSMFRACVNLIQAPVLPATTLAKFCYDKMFLACSNLIQAPILPATILTEHCYYWMFRGCNNINSITMLATDISAEGCLTDWVSRVASTGTFTKAAEMESMPNGSSGIPDGWKVRNYGETIVDNTPYLTFTADATQTLTMSKSVETLEYSIGGDEWYVLGTNTVEFGGGLGNLRIRGKNSTGTLSIKDEGYANISFGNETFVACSGDIRTLLDYENYLTVSTTEARFNNLFMGCSSLISAPELPITDLASYCYYGMFSGCISLTQAPELPATTLSEYCYSYMFTGCDAMAYAPELPATSLADFCYWFMFDYCINLREAPELPATLLANYCYSSMFSRCTSLTQAPELPAITLAYNCYESMFAGCTNLTQAPELPATTLTDYCYFHMFSSCSSLAKAPRLPATTLTTYCYDSMFANCSNLNSITMLATDISAEGCLNDWVSGVSSSGYFTKVPEMESLPVGRSGIPEGWFVYNLGE